LSNFKKLIWSIDAERFQTLSVQLGNLNIYYIQRQQTLSENGNDPIQKQYSISNVSSGFGQQAGFCVYCPASA